jgi:hypothetical protein
MKKTKRKLPTEAQSRILRRIAQNGGLIVLTRYASQIRSYKDRNGGTVISDDGERYHDQSGIPIPADTARRFIAAGWVEPQRVSLFDLTPQTWRVKSGE